MSGPNLLRRNLIGTLVVTGVLGVFYLTDWAEPIAQYRARTVPEHSAPPGGRVEADGLTWQITSSERLKKLPGLLYRPLPPGTVAQVVTISREGSGAEEVCRGVLTDGTRRWQAEGLGLRVPMPPPGTTSDCSAPGPVQFTFIVPADIAPTAVDVVRFQGPITVRLAL